MKRLALSAAVWPCLLAACATEPPPSPQDNPPAAELQCGELRRLTLAPGSHVVVDSIDSASCYRFDNTSTGAEYIAVLYSANGDVPEDDTPVFYRWLGRSAQRAAPASVSPTTTSSPTDDLHDALRKQERLLTRLPAASRRHRVPESVAPIEVGFRRSFAVCADIGCAATANVGTTAIFVGNHVAILLDDDVPEGAFPGSTLTTIGRMLDEHIYPSDTAAFGRESDVDGNGLVLLVVTNQINRLCEQAGGVVTGYFFGRDLLPDAAGSNAAEVFFALAPDLAGTTGCRVTPEFVQRVLPPTFAHELQHMISYHQHVLQHQGPPEETWLNEGLSHLAEDLAGRTTPNGYCLANDCFSQFTFNNVSNAFRYLERPDTWHVVFPETSTGRLAERGATYLLTRWLRDHYGNGHELTRRLLATPLVGAANLSAATGRPFATVLGEWHLANYLDNLPGFTPASARLGYSSWDWRTTFPSLRAQYPQLYSRPLPLVPDSTDGGADLEGSLRRGSGRFVRIVLRGGGEPSDVRITFPGAGGTGGGAVGLAVARVR